MRAKKEIRQDLYRCSVLGEEAHIEMFYETHTSSNREQLVRFGCAECTKCGVGTRISAWQI